MTKTPEAWPTHGNAYNIFILVLTVYSLGIMALLVLPLPISQPTVDLLLIYDNLICVVFLIDFFINMASVPSKSEYFLRRGGWLDLVGFLPSIGIFRLSALFRLARISRFIRIVRILRGDAGTGLVRDIVDNRGQYATFITILSAFIVLTLSSVLMLQFESQAPAPNITTGGDALWWGFATITTVGYGDKYPVTELGRATAVFVMFAGIGIIGALASILASILVPDAPTEAGPSAEAAAAAAGAGLGSEVGPVAVHEAGPGVEVGAAIAVELANLRAEIAALRAAVIRDGA